MTLSPAKKGLLLIVFLAIAFTAWVDSIQPKQSISIDIDCPSSYHYDVQWVINGQLHESDSIQKGHYWDIADGDNVTCHITAYKLFDDYEELKIRGKGPGEGQEVSTFLAGDVVSLDVSGSKEAKE